MDRKGCAPNYLTDRDLDRIKPMTVIVNLRPETEKRLATLAAAQGISLDQFVSRLIEGYPPGQSSLSPLERAAFWRESATGLPDTPPLSDAAISRESIYDTRG